MLTSETLSFERAALRLRTVLFRRPSDPPETVFTKTIEALQNVVRPMIGREIAELLAEKGINHGCKPIIVMMRAHPDTFVRLRNGFMLRSKWSHLSKKWFQSTAEVVETARLVLAKSRRPLSLQEILDSFDRLGFQLYGRGRPTLGGILTEHPHVFENIHIQKGVWQLRRGRKKAA